MRIKKTPHGERCLYLAASRAVVLDPISIGRQKTQVKSKDFSGAIYFLM
jgi:hypothetical protein